MKLLLISDLRSSFDAFCQCLDELEHVYEFIASGDEAVRKALESKSDLVVIKSHNGFDATPFIRHLREKGYCDPVLVMVADNLEETRIAAFDGGADQVVMLEATDEEWKARVRALLRNCDAQPGDILTYADLEVNLPKMAVTRAGRPLKLRGKPFALLEYFMRNPERVLSRDQIADHVWGHDFDLFSNSIDVILSRVRAAVDRDFDHRYLHTVRERGWMLSTQPPGA